MFEEVYKGWLPKVGGISSGAAKAFYTVYEAEPGMSEDFGGAALIDATGREKPAYYAMRTLMEKLDYPTSVEKLSDGQYKFTVSNKPVYVLWGTGNAPSEITGTVTVTDISGAAQQKQASEITLSYSPIYVEPA